MYMFIIIAQAAGSEVPSRRTLAASAQKRTSGARRMEVDPPPRGKEEGPGAKARGPRSRRTEDDSKPPFADSLVGAPPRGESGAHLRPPGCL